MYYWRFWGLQNNIATTLTTFFAIWRFTLWPTPRFKTIHLNNFFFNGKIYYNLNLCSTWTEIGKSETTKMSYVNRTHKINTNKDTNALPTYPRPTFNTHSLIIDNSLIYFLYETWVVNCGMIRCHVQGRIRQPRWKQIWRLLWAV